MNTIISPDQKQYHFVFMLSAQEVSIINSHHGYRIELKKIDPKVLYMTARPGRSRAFVVANQFMATWIKNKSIFRKNSPQVAIIHSGMKTDSNDTAKAIPIEIFDPELTKEGFFVFNKINFCGIHLQPGRYRGVVFFIDWLPASECPEPIKLELPGLFLEK